jgi:hypothetical protein
MKTLSLLILFLFATVFGWSQQPSHLAEYRTWTSASGSTVEAVFYSQTYRILPERTIWLMTRDGKIITLQYPQLSASDQTYISCSVMMSLKEAETGYARFLAEKGEEIPFPIGDFESFKELNYLPGEIKVLSERKNIKFEDGRIKTIKTLKASLTPVVLPINLIERTKLFAVVSSKSNAVINWGERFEYDGKNYSVRDGVTHLQMLRPPNNEPITTYLIGMKKFEDHFEVVYEFYENRNSYINPGNIDMILNISTNTGTSEILGVKLYKKVSTPGRYPDSVKSLMGK